jgi:DNA-3-methyladenine glycosylase
VGLGLTGTWSPVVPGPVVSGALLPREFFARPAPEVAPGLLGCVLWHQSAAGPVAVQIVEVEAYAGESDPASHAFRGRTARNAVMFGPPGHAYVYFTYGMHFCVNLVCQPAGHAAAVLLRAGRVIEGAELAAVRRSGARQTSAARRIDLARGPARLCQALGIDRALDGADVCDPASSLRVLAPRGAAGGGPVSAAGPAAGGGPVSGGGPAAGGGPVSGGGPAAGGGPVSATGPAISCGPRVGVSRAAEIGWRFWITGERTVSPYRPSAPRRPRAKPVSGAARDDGTMHR